MPFGELKGFARETFLAKKVDELTRVYSEAQKSLIKKLGKVDITEFQKTRTEALLLQVNNEIVNLNKYARKWAKESMDNAYGQGLDIAQERLQSLGVTRFVNYGSRIHRSAVDVLINEVTIDLVTANQSMKDQTHRHIRLTQQRVLEDQEISRLLAQGVIEGETRRARSDLLLKAFQKRMEKGQLLTINGRNYEPKSYVNLLARTRFIEASTRANINSSLQYGVDLMQVSVHHHPQEDPCSKHQGRVYSISGSDPDFPVLQETPPFHPNCRHVLLPITRESLEGRGLLESTKEFSNSTHKPGKATSFKDFEKEVSTSKRKKKAEKVAAVKKRKEKVKEQLDTSASKAKGNAGKGKSSHDSFNTDKVGIIQRTSGYNRKDYENKDALDTIMKELGINDRAKALEYREAIMDWTAWDYTDIRKYQADPKKFLASAAAKKDPKYALKIQRHAKRLDEYIKQRPAFDGSIYRGLAAYKDGKKVLTLDAFKEGAILQDKSISAWTAKSALATRIGGFSDYVLIMKKGSGRTAYIDHLSMNPNNKGQEVLLHGNTKLKIVKVDKDRKFFGASQPAIYVEEVIE